MQIKFGEKGEVLEEVLLEDKEEHHHQPHDTQSKCCRRPQYGWCGGSWLTVLIVAAVVLVCQMWLVLYLVHSWSSTYTPAGHFFHKDTQGKLHHVKFSWSNCGSNTDPAKLVHLQVNPDPLSISRNITLDLVAYLGLSVDKFSAVVKVKRHVGWFWVPMPCIDEYGSCHYPDACQLSPFPAPATCPDPFPRFKLPCRCPIKKGPYIVHDGVFNITAIVASLPSWLLSGDYHARVSTFKDDTQLGCYEFYVSVSS